MLYALQLWAMKKSIVEGHRKALLIAYNPDAWFSVAGKWCGFYEWQGKRCGFCWWWEKGAVFCVLCVVNCGLQNCPFIFIGSGAGAA